MKLLVVGSGGREHALCWKLSQSPDCEALFCAPGNAGIAELASCVTLDDHAAIEQFCQAERIDLVVIGPEQPLVDGLADRLRAASIAVLGPSQQAAQLEGSKAFTKSLCDRYDIPTAAYASFTDGESALDYVRKQGAPIVIKADGLAAGKGVTVAETLTQAEEAVRDCFDGAFGAAGARVVIEECLMGEEVSLFALSDGETIIELGSAQDHKRVGEGDTGSNTGGMGTYSPAPVMDEAMRERAMREIVRPAIEGMAKDGMPYQGILFAGLMITSSGPKLIEFNCRFGDPEAQVLLPRMQGDLLTLFYQAATGSLKQANITLSDQHALCVVMAANGYPGAYEKGSVIEGVEALRDQPNLQLFHAGTRRGRNCGKLKANGGRVLGVTAWSETLEDAHQRAYRAVDAIDWPHGFCRRDIGWRALSPQAGAAKESA